MTSSAQARSGGQTSDKVPVFQVLAQDLQNLGVEAVFGLMSDDTALFATALDSLGVRFYGARHENNAIAMADGYAYATGRLGVAVIGRGPALANGLHGGSLCQPYWLALSSHLRRGGNIGAAQRAGTRLQGGSTASACCGRPACAPSPQRARRRARTVLADAAAAAMAGARGQLAPADQRPARRDRAAGAARLSFDIPRVSRLQATAQSIAAAAAVLAKAKRPLILAGLGAHRAGAREAIEALAEQDRRAARYHGARQGPVPWQSHAISASSARSRTRSRGAWRSRPTACWCSAPVSTSSPPASAPRCRKVPLIQVDTVRANIGRWLNADVAVVGDARLVAEQLAEALSRAAARSEAFPR